MTTLDHDSVLMCNDVIGFGEVISASVLFSCNNSRMAGRNFITFGADVMPFEAIRNPLILMWRMRKSREVIRRGCIANDRQRMRNEVIAPDDVIDLDDVTCLRKANPESLPSELGFSFGVLKQRRVWKWRRKQTFQHRALIHELLNFQSSSLISRCRKRAGKRWVGDRWLTVHFTTLFQ
jgi:hypothetical protein